MDARARGRNKLRALVATPDGADVDETRTGSLDAGDRETFDLDVPADGEGTLSRERGSRVSPVAVGATGVAVGLGAGVVGSRAVRNDGGADEDSEAGSDGK